LERSNRYGVTIRVEWVDRLRRDRDPHRRRDGCASGFVAILKDEYVVATSKGLAILDVTPLTKSPGKTPPSTNPRTFAD
jgi:hypothetical protein